MRTPASRAQRRSTYVPCTSVSMKSAASRIERSTCVSAAKFTTASTPAPASATASGSQMSPSTNSASTPSRLARLPAEVSLSRTTTSSPPATSRRAKCEPINPAPPVTSTRMAVSLVESPLRPQALEAGAQPLAPGRQAGSVRPPAAQDRVRGPRGGAAELGRRDRADEAVEPGFGEDGLRELGPRAVPAAGDVMDALLERDDRPRRRGEMPDVGRAAALVVDHRHLVPLGAEPEHRPDEVVPGRSEQPRRADDPAVADLPLAVQLRPAVDGERGRLVRLDVRAVLRPVEDVVAGEVDDRRTEGDDVPRAEDVDLPRAGR